MALVHCSTRALKKKWALVSHAKSLEFRYKIHFTADGREEKLFGDENENKGSAGIATTSGGEGISNFPAY